MEGILGDRPSCRPPGLLDSFREDDVASSADCEEPECENINIPDEPPDTPQTASSETSGSSNDTTSFNERASSSVSTTEVPTRASTPTPCSISTGPQQKNCSLSKNICLFTGALTTCRKRKNKLESTMDVFSKTIKEALSQADDTELQLKLQAAQYAHELKMMTLFTQFLAGIPSYQPPPHPGHATGFSQDFSHPAPFTQDHTHNRTPLLPPDTPPPKTFTTLQPPPSQQGRICSNGWMSAMPNGSTAPGGTSGGPAALGSSL
ncbi:unnamed protein product [Leuciscus chuanchicus]